MVTIEDIARLSGVSTMTVSRVVNKSSSVKSATRDKVLKVIEETGYKPNMNAKSLVCGKSKTIGVLSSNYYNQAYLDIVVAIEDYAYGEGVTVIDANVNDYVSACNAVDLFLGKQVEGIVVLPLEMKMTEVADYRESLKEIARFSDYFKDTVKKHGVPVITVSQKIDEIENVAFDFAGVAKVAMDKLIQKGYRDITMLNSNIDAGLWKEKEEIYLAAMKKAGAEEFINVEKDVALVEGGRKAMERVLQKRTPRAVFCANDYMAIGALQALNKRKISIPEEVAVIGNDDVVFCEMTSPRLTSVSLCMKESGNVAIKRLFELIDGAKPCEDVTSSISYKERETI